MQRILDRLPEFDDKSRSFNVRAVVPVTEPRSYTWACTPNLDQGSEGACVGFSWTHERAARPKPDLDVTDAEALAIYQMARRLDQWPGEDYDGTSVIAGAKAAQTAGWLTEYRWAFNVHDALVAISRKGPAVIGVNWYSGMWDADRDGFLHVEGNVVGGHAILVRGVDVVRERVLLHNSWGRGWGGTAKGPGTAWLSFADFERLLREDGECCIPTARL
jgi:hypothetical protein